MTETVKVLYEERNSRLQGKSSKSSRREGYLGGKIDEKNPFKGNGGKPPPYPPSSSSPSSPSYSSSSTTTVTQTIPHTKGFMVKLAY